MQKSTSKSGIETRSGFKNRSNRRSCSIGSEIRDAENERHQGSRARAAARPDRHAIVRAPTG